MSIRNPDQRVGVFVDVQNLYYSARNMYNARVKFNEVLEAAVGGRRLIRAIAYCVKADMPEEHTFLKLWKRPALKLKLKSCRRLPAGTKKGIGMSGSPWILLS